MDTDKTFPVIEIFGPTIQGEGPDAGQPCHFIRFGGCDYRCSWCDSMYAVEPAEVRANAEDLDAGEIIARVRALDGGPTLIVLSGGNPALLQLGSLVEGLQRSGYKVSMETQGSRWQDWIGNLDKLVASPKPPSSGMISDAHETMYRFFFNRLREETAFHPERPELAIKIVVFDEADYRWALDWYRMSHVASFYAPLYLSVGTMTIDEWKAGGRVEPTRDEVATEDILPRYQWLASKVASDPLAAHVKVLPQLHVLAFGTGRGV